MKTRTSEDLSKLQVVCSLFSKTVSNDLYYAQQIKESIEASLPGDQSGQAKPFISRAKELVEKLEREPPHTGVELVEALPPSEAFSMLELRACLLDALKAVCRFDTGLVVLTGLKEAICPHGKRWTQRRKKDYEDAICFARDFCHKRSRPTSRLSLVIF